MKPIDPNAARQFAVETVQKLRAAGFEALWAGGCVRDQLLGQVPKDYDVATNATPDQIREVLGRRRTLAIGAAFGVITVLGPRRAGQIEVATFRRDAAYSDGRHPDSVTFSSAEEDAKRRDFTINGLFYDPVADRVIDHVNGQLDLQRHVIRAIGDPHERFAEDKLRMLRAVRFAATFDFRLDEATLAAIQEHAGEITIVSAERIADEMRRILPHANRARAVNLLRESGLLEIVLPEAVSLWTACDTDISDSDWQRTLHVLQELNEPSFPQALAGLLHAICRDTAVRKCAAQICRRWKLSNEESDRVAWLLSHIDEVRRASRIAWPKLQRILIQPAITELLALAEGIAKVVDRSVAEIELCRERLALPEHELNPLPLIDGNDLRTLGIAPGPLYKKLLEKTRDAQLDGRLNNKQAALSFAKQLSESLSGSAHAAEAKRKRTR